MQIRTHATATISELRAAAVGQPVFLAERIRRALATLATEERWLFSTKLRAGPFDDLLYDDKQIEAEISGEKQGMVGAQGSMARVGAATMQGGANRRRAIKRQREAEISRK